MIHLIDAYVVGFSALSFYVLKTYFEARVVWKQWLQAPLAVLVDLNLACLLLSTIPGLRTLISGFSVIGYSTREMKYITPGVDKGWRAKHEGLVLCFLALRVLTLITGIEHKMYGWDAISSVRRL